MTLFGISMYYHILILLFYIFYISGNIGIVTLGLPKPLLIGIPLVYSLFIAIAYKRMWAGVEKYTLLLVAGAVLVLLFRYIVNGETDLKQDAAILVLPALLVSALATDAEFKIQTLETKRLIACFLFIFYVVECGVALYEYIVREHLFGWLEQTYYKGIVSFGKHEEFRSAALLGAPLNNALVVTTLMLFYLFGDRYSMRNKILLWTFGLIAVFCFNARLAIVVNLASMLVFLVKGLSGKYTAARINIILIFLFICLVVSILYFYGIGERFWNTDNIRTDSSMGPRLKLFKYLLDKNWTDFLWGNSSSQIRHDMAISIKIKVIENFWVQYIFRYGIVATSFFTFCYYNIGKHLLSGYSQFNKITISLFFLLLASSNISLATQYTPLAVFLLCCYVYRPVRIKDWLASGIISSVNSSCP